MIHLSLILMVVYASVFSAVLSFRKVSIFRFDSIFTITFLFSAVLSILPMMQHEKELTTSTALYLIAFHFFINMGFIATGYGLELLHHRRQTVKKAQSPFSYYHVLMVAAVCFCLLSAISSVIQGKVPILSNMSQLEELRVNYLANSESGILPRAIAAMSHFAILFVVLAPRFVKGRWSSWLWSGLAFAFLVDHSLSTGARASIVIVVIALLAVFFQTHRIKRMQLLGLLFSGLILVYLLGVVFYLKRNGDFEKNPDFFAYKVSCGGHFHPVIERSSTELKALVLSLSYFSSPPYFFQSFMDQTNWQYPYMWGGYNFSFLWGSHFVNAREVIEAEFLEAGFGGNPWATFARDMYIDFGPFAFPFALLVGVAFRWLLGTRFEADDMTLVRFGMLASAGFLAPFISPLIIRPIVYPILLSIVIQVAVGAVASRRRQRQQMVQRPKKIEIRRRTEEDFAGRI